VDETATKRYNRGPVKVISDSAPGSAPDVILCSVADRPGSRLGPADRRDEPDGASGSVAARAAAGSTPDEGSGCQPFIGG